jgi:hypothetical protein
VSESRIGAADDAFTGSADLSPLERRILQPATGADVAARCSTVLPDGRRQYSTLVDDAATAEIWSGLGP